MDQLIAQRLENIRSAYARERVSYEDPFAAMVTVGEALRECSKIPKFYDSDEIDAIEIGLMTRQILVQTHWQFVATAHKRLNKIHGWAVTMLNTDMAGRLSWHTWSELTIGPEDFIREWQLPSFIEQVDPQYLPLVLADLTGDRNRVVGWRLTGRNMRLPLNRPMGNVLPERGYVWRAQPGVIYTTRGDESETKGFGISRLESGWDSITKLRLESHADAFRSQIFAQVVHPPNWDDDQLDTLMDVLQHIDQTTALCLPAGKNADGTLVPDLPSITFRTMAEDARQKSDKGSGGVFSNLSSEFVRYCGNYKIPISEVTGNPGGAIESADVDATKAIEEKVHEYNLGRNFDMQFIEQLRLMGAQIDLPEGGYVVKGWQEWEAHEKALQEQQMAEEEMLMKQERGSQSFDDRSNSYCSGCPYFKETDSGFSICTYKGDGPFACVRDQKTSKKKKNAYLELGYVANAVLRENVPPGVFTPITSSWVRGYGYDQAGDFYAEFHSKPGTIFKYGSETLDGETTAEEMEQSGSPGGYVHDTSGFWKARGGNYQMLGSLPPSMAYWSGSRALFEAQADSEHQEKKSRFGRFRPAVAPNPNNYPARTSARSESTMGGSGSLGGTAMGGPVNMAGILSGIRGLGMPRSFQGPDFTAMQGAVPSQQPATAMLPQPQIQQIGTPAVSQQPMSTGIAPGPQGRGRPGQVNPTVPKMHGGRSPQGAPTIAAKEAQENPRTSEETQPGLAPNPSKPKLHGGHSPRGRPSEEKKAGQFSTMPSWQQWNKGLEEDINATAMMVRRVNSTVEDLSVKDWDRISRDLTGQGFGNTTIEKVIQVVKNTNLVKRYNYVAKGNTMSFKNHPYLYRDNDGNVSVEYPCARDWRKNVVGQVGKLKINFQSPGEHGETEIGTVSYGWDEENDCPDDILEYDRDAVMQELERHNQHESEVYKRLKEAKDPDQSTEYMCRTTVHNNRKWQIDFKPDPDTGRFDTCLVNFGNCPSGQCDFTGDITAR